MGRLRDTALVRCDLCVNGGGVLADLCGALDDFWCCSLSVWLGLGCFVGGFDCAVVFVVLVDAGPLLLSLCNTHCNHTYMHTWDETPSHIQALATLENQVNKARRYIAWMHPPRHTRTQPTWYSSVLGEVLMWHCEMTHRDAKNRARGLQKKEPSLLMLFDVHGCLIYRSTRALSR